MIKSIRSVGILLAICTLPVNVCAATTSNTASTTSTNSTTTTSTFFPTLIPLITTDTALINQFCINYKADLAENFALITTENVTSETYSAFSILVQDRLVNANIKFFEALQALGATQCQF